jgi:hypothetical protein
MSTPKRIKELEHALHDAISTYTGSDKIVTAERIECWQSALKGDPACRSKRPDDICDGCDCWKATRRNCS